MHKVTTSLTGIASLCLLGGFAVAPPAYAAEEADVIEEIVVTGTRREGRTVMDSAAPIDVFQGEALDNQASVDMDSLLRNLIPSYNVNPIEISDGSTLVRPATLRGLPPDSSLVLINGKRRHRSAMYAVFGGDNAAGAQGPDMYMIPSMALKRVEVLRDGAAAQYGSDAISGVLNFILRDANDGFTIEAKYGQYFESDSIGPLLNGHGELMGDLGNGDTVSIAANIGLPLTDDGFFNATLEWSENDPTTRSVQRGDASTLINAGRAGIRNPVQIWGRPRTRDNYIGFANWAFAASETAEVYGHASYGERNVRGGFFYRNPDSRFGVFTGDTNAAGERLRLVADITGDFSGNCLGNPTSNPANPELPIGNLAGLASVMADPNCFVFNQLFPGGFTPEFGAHINDTAIVAGIRGAWDTGLSYDFSVGWGRSDVEYSINNTVNASLGPLTPVRHRPGDYVQQDKNFNADFVYPMDVDWLYSPLNVAFGLEIREEQFEVIVGSEDSWKRGVYVDQGFTLGSNGFQGFNPFQSGVDDVGNYALYVDLEGDVTERFLVGVAIRYEDFDTWGDDTNGKLSLRYKVTDRFNVRATVSTGFRAPTVAQQNLTNTQTGTDDAGMLITQGLVPATNPIAALFGATPLGPEESVSVSVGFTWEVTDNLSITADYFDIDIDDRLAQSADIDILAATISGFCAPSDPVLPTCSAALEATGIPGASELVQFNFNTNDFDTTTSGIDIVATYSYDWDNIGSTSVNFAYNWTDTEVDSASGISVSCDDVAALANTIMNRDRCKGIEDGLPDSRFNLTATHFYQDWRFLVRVNWHDDWTVWRNNPQRDQFGDSAFYVDAEVAYTWRDQYTFVLGAQNLFDELPPEMCFGSARDPNLCEQLELGQRYIWSSPFGSQGGFWYGRFRYQM